MNTNIKAISYLRVSTDLQDYNRQIEDIQVYCQNNQLELVKTFEEKESGRKKNRTAVKEMLEYLQANKIQYLVISELSRLGRTAEVPVIVEELNDLKVCLISLKEGLRTLNQDLSINTTSSLIISVIAGISTFELSTLNYRIKSGKQHKALQGRYAGGCVPTFGYDVQDKRYVVNTSEAQVVKSIFKMYSEGKGTSAIADYLNAAGITTKTGKKWYAQMLLPIINNKIYIGINNYKDQEFNQAELQIINTDLFEQANERRQGNVNKMHKIIKKYNYLLTEKRILTCGCCGRHYFGNSNVVQHKHLYTCYTKKIKGNCDSNSINIEALDSAVIEVIQKYYSSEAEKKVDVQYYQELIRIAEAKIEELQGNEAKYEQQRSKVLDLFIDGLLSKEQRDNRLQAIQAKQAQDSLAITRLGADITNYQYFIDLPEEFEDLNQDKLKNLIQSLVIYPQGKENRLELVIRGKKTIFTVHKNKTYTVVQLPMHEALVS